MVFVDELFVLESRNPQAFHVGERNGHRWCHLTCDADIDELHAMARRIGLRRDWFQCKGRTPHYDLTPGKRRLAIACGAQVRDRRVGEPKQVASPKAPSQLTLTW